MRITEFFPHEWRAVARLASGLALAVLAAGPVRLGAECRTNVSLADAIQFGDGPLAEPSARFPYIAYSLNAKYATFYNQTKSDIMTDECAREPFAVQASGSYEGARSLASLSSAGGTPDFRFRSKGSLSQEEALARVASVGAGGKFRFRDVISFDTTRSNLIRVAVTISMDGNVSLPMATIPLPEQPGDSFVRVNITDVEYCQGPSSQFVNLSRRSATSGPDYHATYIFDACPTALVRIDVLVELNATASRFVSIGGHSYVGGYTFADYTQCVNGNSVCYEDCAEDELQNCSGFSIRAHVIDPPAADGENGLIVAAALPSVRLVSAAGLDYSAPLRTFQPSLHVRKEQTDAIIQWPSTGNEWTAARSSDFAAWSPITNRPALDLDSMMFQLRWPLTNAQQFFRLEKPIVENP